MSLAMLQKNTTAASALADLPAIAWITCCSQRLWLQWGLKLTVEAETKGRKLVQPRCPRNKPAGKWEFQCLSQTLQFPIDFSQPSVSRQPAFGWVTMDPCKSCRNEISLYIRSVSGPIADIRNGLLQGKKNPTTWQLNISSPLNISPSTQGGTGTRSHGPSPVKVTLSKCLAEKGLPGNISISMQSVILRRKPAFARPGQLQAPLNITYPGSARVRCSTVHWSPWWQWSMHFS